MTIFVSLTELKFNIFVRQKWICFYLHFKRVNVIDVAKQISNRNVFNQMLERLYIYIYPNIFLLNLNIKKVLHLNY